jgi:hypothetical protein
MTSRRTPWIVMLPALVLIFGLAAAQAPPAALPSVPRPLDVPNNALVAPGQAPEVELLYTGDVIGFIEPCG